MKTSLITEKWNEVILLSAVQSRQKMAKEFHPLESGRLIDRVSRVFANGPGDRGWMPIRVIPKIQKMVLDADLLNTQHYKIRIEGEVEQYRERSNALPYTLL